MTSSAFKAAAHRLLTCLQQNCTELLYTSNKFSVPPCCPAAERKEQVTVS